MKNEIVSNNYFELIIDQSKNRLYITSSGFWPKKIVEEYMHMQTKALKNLSRSFTVIADMREFKILAKDLVSMQKRTHEQLVEYGMSKVAEVVPESTIANMQLKQVTSRSDMKLCQFASIVEAENWLDGTSSGKPILPKYSSKSLSDTNKTVSHNNDDYILDFKSLPKKYLK